jgi:hypothetical protein
MKIAPLRGMRQLRPRSQSCLGAEPRTGEGEVDALTSIECGFPLSVSVPDGAPAVPEGEKPDELEPIDPGSEHARAGRPVEIYRCGSHTSETTATQLPGVCLMGVAKLLGGRTTDGGGRG